MNKQQLATKIWESANKMRSKIEANEYKDYILGFIFYKYLSDKELAFLQKEGFTPADIAALTEDDAETVKYVRENLGYFIAHNNLFTTWLGLGNKFDVSNVTDALSAFNRLINPSHKKVFEGIFNTLQTGLSKLGESAGARTKAISDLLQLIKDIPMDNRQDYDVLGFIYEYLINMFAANAGKKAGEFYTPHEVSLLMSEIVAHHLKDRKEINIYDPTSGSGSLLINIGRSVSKFIPKDNVKYYAQELKQNTYNLTRMNLVMRGILPDNIITRNGDTLEDDWPFFDESDPNGSYNPLYVDAVFSNPPYSQHWDPSHKETDARYARFGLAPKTKADYAFLLHDLFHLKPEGIMTIVLPHGVLFRGGEEGQIRRKLVEGNHIDAIIGLPPNVFFGTGIPTIVMVLRQKRPHTDVLIIDASKGFLKVGKNNKLRASDIKKIVDTFIARSDVAKFAKKVLRDDIRKNDYNLNIPRYVDSSDDAETWDIYASMFGGIPQSEVAELAPYWQALPGLQEALFTASTTPYTQVAVEDIRKAIHSHPAVTALHARFATAFAGFTDYLRQELITNIMEVNIARQEETLSRAMFTRLEAMPLVDSYEAYQLLDDAWTKTAVDLEILQTEGFEAVRKVDPNMVLKKKDNKEEEVQDGWVGRVIPFALVQQTLLAGEYAALHSKENRLAEITAECAELLDGLTEEDKETECINEAKDAFVAAKVGQEAKRLQAEVKEGAVFEAESLEQTVLTVHGLLTEEKSLKSAIKKEAAALHMHTKATIEGLTDAQAHALLEQKWISPLVEGLHKLPEQAVQTLAEKVQALAEKYATTFAAVEADIATTSTSLAAMLNDFVGDEFDMQGLQEFRNLLGGE